MGPEKKIDKNQQVYKGNDCNNGSMEEDHPPPTKCRPQKGSRDKQSCRQSALRLAEHVGNDAPGVRHRRRTKRARKEAKNQQGRDVGRARRRHAERRVRRV